MPTVIALAGCIVRLTRESALRRAMEQNNMGRVRREYLPQVFAFRMANQYDRLLQRGSTREED